MSTNPSSQPAPQPPTHPPPLPSLHAPTELDLSPSKARAHATTTHAWSQVTQWLTSTTALPTPLPAFERTPETLAYLQTLMRANRVADASARELESARRSQVVAYDTYGGAAGAGAEDEDGEIGAMLLRELQDSLGVEGEAALASLAEGCVTLGFVPGDGAGGEDVEGEMGRRMLGLTAALCEAQVLVDRVERLRREFVEEGSRLGGDAEGDDVGGRKGEHDEVGEEPEGDEHEERMSIAALRTKTAQLSAQTKHLALKAAEYRERRAALEQSGGGIRASTTELKQRERELEAQKDIVRRLESSLKEFHGLPPDLEASRAEVKRAQAELEMLKRKREELFEEYGGG